MLGHRIRRAAWAAAIAGSFILVFAIVAFAQQADPRQNAALHEASPRRSAELVVVDCGSLPATLAFASDLLPEIVQQRWMHSPPLSNRHRSATRHASYEMYSV